MIRIKDIKLPVGHDAGDLMDETAKIMCLDRIYPGNSYPDFSYEIIRRSVDARKNPEIFYIYTVKILTDPETEERIRRFLEKNSVNPRIRRSLEKILLQPTEEYRIPKCGDTGLHLRPVIVGAGPSGLFCGLMLARCGFEPVIIERGGDVDNRSRSVEEFWKSGKLDPESNVQFGEGGAGTFSDGKLVTLTKDKGGINTYVINTFYEHGAPKEITWEARPHIGTDILRSVVRSIREEIISCRGEVLFNTKLTGISTSGTGKDRRITSVNVTDLSSGRVRDINTDICVLCLGHSARDTFEMLYGLGINMNAKNFAAGFRVMHPQSSVNFWQYGTEDAKSLGLAPAEYKVTNETSKGRRVYSFCMCPGGYVVNASSEAGRLVVNGMSENDRGRKFANSAIVVAVDPDDFIQDTVRKDHPLAGMYYQRRLEEEAFRRGSGSIPVQVFEDFENDRITEDTGYITDGVKGSVKSANLRRIFSDEIDEAVIESMHKFGYTRKGFDTSAIMLGIEMRTSCPLRIERDEGYECNIAGLYPCGEGAGYAGGITSAAADGLRCAEKIIRKYHPEV